MPDYDADIQAIRQALAELHQQKSLPPSEFEMSDIRNSLSDLQRSLGNVTGLLQGHIAKVDEHFTETDDRMKGHDRRLRHMEEKQAWWAGGAAAVGAVLGFLGTHLFSGGSSH